MVVTITSLELKSPLRFFSLSYRALHIVRQIKQTGCLIYRSTGFWTLHYTLTAWNTVEELKTFSKSGAHLQAMKHASELAKEICTLTYETDHLPDWKEAKALLKAKGRVLTF